MELCIGIRGTVLDWFRSFLSNRRFSVSIGQYSSSVAHSSCGVPQGSTLAPLLFSLYMLPIGSIFRKFGASYHCYADDTQLYIPFKRNDKSALYQLTACLQELKAWLTNNFLHLNDDKTRIVLFRPNEKTDLSTVDLGSLSPYYSSEVKDLGFILDSDLKLNKQINYTVSASFYHLRRVAKVKPFLSRKSFEIIIHAFISSRLDYCNLLYYGLPVSSILRLQLVQNAAARLLTGSHRRNHITPMFIA